MTGVGPNQSDMGKMRVGKRVVPDQKEKKINSVRTRRRSATFPVWFTSSGFRLLLFLLFPPTSDLLFSFYAHRFTGRLGWNPHGYGASREIAATDLPEKSPKSAADHGVLAVSRTASTTLPRVSSLPAMVFLSSGCAPSISAWSSAIECLDASGPSSSRAIHSRS